MASGSDDPRVGLLRELADPVRLRVVDRLGHDGPATVSELAAAFGVSLPQLSNHLRRLREAGLVEVQRSGRQAVYSLADPGLHALLPLLDRLTARVAPAPPPQPHAPDGRSCYAHLGGRVGVAIYRALAERGAIVPAPDGTVALGPELALLRALGVDPGAVEPGRRRFAFECLDAVEHAGHLAGALGDAVSDALAQRGWIEHAGPGRDLRVTRAGARGLRAALGIDLRGFPAIAR